MLIMREKYDIQILAPMGMDLHNTKVVQRYIEDHIVDRIRERMVDFVEEHDEPPGVIRLAGSDFTSVKEHLQRLNNGSYIYAKDLKLDGIKIKATCESGRGKVILDSEYEEDAEDAEE